MKRMEKFGAFIAKHRVIVLIVATLLLLPAAYGMVNTKVNYDLLTYLPENLDSTKGQQILENEFSNAATAMLMVEGMSSKEVVALKDEVATIKGVEKVIWIDDFSDITLPEEMLPSDIADVFYQDNSTLMMIKFKESSSSPETGQAIVSIRQLAGKRSFLAGISAIIKDTKDIADQETGIYVLVAVVLSAIVLALTNESVLIPFVFLLGIGYAVLYNMGTNYFFKEISYVTKIIAAVLQLGVTMDYSIFLFHRYDEERKRTDETKEQAMAIAVKHTMASITGSSLTTIAGFLALSAMSLTLGRDIGFVMAKGVIFGLLSTITILPALILAFDKPIHRFNHGMLLPKFDKTAKFVTKHYKGFVALFLLLFIPAIYGSNHTKVYYNLDESLPRDLPSIIATTKLKNDYGMTSTHFIIVDKSVSSHNMNKMVNQIEELPGIHNVLTPHKFIGPSVPDEFWPEEIKQNFEKGDYQLMIANSEYKAASQSIANQLEAMTEIVKSYDQKAMISGEGALTKDLTEIADTDFKRVSFFSILAVFVIILILFTSLSIPIILVLAIELAIFINMGIPFYMGTTIPFVSSIVIGTIQLGSTIDYAILMTTRFREEIRRGHDRFTAMENTVQGTARSIVTSALAFFAATAGVGIMSDMEMISSLCGMMARGAIISMLVIIFVLPSILLISEKVINATSRNFETSVLDKVRQRRADNIQ